MLHLVMATHSLKGTLTNWVLKISNDVIVTSFLNQSQQNFVFLFVIQRDISVQNLSKIRQETKKLHEMGNDIIVTSFLKIAQQFLCVSIFYSYLLMYQVLS